MITKASISIAVVAALCFGGSFLGTVATRSQGTTTSAPAPASPLVQRLNLDAEQVQVLEAHDPQFAEDLQTLREKLERARSMLADVFEREDATDDDIRQRVEAAIEAHNQLERRVAEYLIAVRDHLTPKQQRQLYNLCAEKVRECGQRWRRGWGRHGGSGGGNGRGKGGGCGREHKHGRGRAHEGDPDG